MNDCKKSRLLFDEVFFDEITDEDKYFLDQHLKNCPKCRTELSQNTSLLTGITKKKANEPDSDFWDNYTANLHQRMLSEGHLAGDQSSKEHPKIKLLPQISRWFTAHSVPAWAIQGAAAVILVILGIFIGRYFFIPDPPGTQTPPANSQNNALLTAGQSAQQQALKRTGSFINRSRLILLAIENFDPETQSTQAINFPYQKEVSKDLVKRAISLKQELSKTRQRKLKELITELEIILLQIANMDPGSEIETIQLVKGGNYIRGMLYKIRINDLRRYTYKTTEEKRF